ncbi:succinoglycan biosynthesis protein ExoL [Nitrospirillum pindoramense]|uniref:Succinoglycan biosynthesis protein ExoL n=2 Tax=Nitrospirillum amazonense TaxID=28077 RepID=A0A560HHU7_9PROT|nr:succinoglycan biosynthesis protein ExoL [Nitrospirillum amazonense]
MDNSPAASATVSSTDVPLSPPDGRDGGAEPAGDWPVGDWMAERIGSRRGSADAGKVGVVFLTQDITDVSTIKRVREFLDNGLPVLVLGFERARYNSGYRPPWPHVLLGRTVDGKYAHRLQALAGALRVIFRNRARLTDATVLYARNIDQLLLALVMKWFISRKAELVYEVLDIQPMFVAHGLRSLALRLVERLCLTQVKLLVLSSPGFHRHYYAPTQKFRGPWLLVENKLPRPGLPERPSPLPASPAPASTGTRPLMPPDRPWVIGYFGLIRGEQTVDLMRRLAQRLPDRLQIRFRGVLTTVDEKSFFKTLEACPNILYGGRYDHPGELADMYAGVDFAWALDLENTEHNSRWLLPNRFYEAGYFGVPCLSVRGFEVDRLVTRHDVGWGFDQPLEETMVRFFQDLTPEDYERKRQRLLSLPDETFVAGEEIRALCRFFARRAGAPREQPPLEGGMRPSPAS